MNFSFSALQCAFMKAWIKRDKGLRLEDIPIPNQHSDELLLEVRRSRSIAASSGVPHELLMELFLAGMSPALL